MVALLLPLLVTAPVSAGIVVTVAAVVALVALAARVALPAVRLFAVPVMLVPTKADGVPRAGFVRVALARVGAVANTRFPEPVVPLTLALSSAEVAQVDKADKLLLV